MSIPLKSLFQHPVRDWAHAMESVDDIFRRKMADASAIGQTFWLVTSSKVRPLVVQEICRATGGYVVFIESSGVPRPTVAETAAREYSVDRNACNHYRVVLGR